nr:hypothetical protein [Mucilaginibacter sp. X5P1]
MALDMQTRKKAVHETDLAKYIGFLYVHCYYTSILKCYLKPKTPPTLTVFFHGWDVKRGFYRH